MFNIKLNKNGVQMNKITLKIKTFFLLLKNPKIRLFFLIDILFYGYSFFGFLGAINYGIYYDLSIGLVALSWSLVFVPILILKFYKEINKDKIEKRKIYDK